MNEKTFRALEFNKILSMLEKLAVNDLGKKICQNLLPSSYIDEIEKNQQETQEAYNIITNTNAYPIHYCKDISEHLSLAYKGSVLTMKMLLEVSQFLQACSSTKKELSASKNQEISTCLNEYADLIIPYPNLYREINTAIISEEEISDFASAELHSIRKQIKLVNEKIKSKLQSFIRQSEYQTYLQESIITMRNGRYVLPVKLEHRNQIKGLIHDQSSTGATLFIEPIAIVEAGNELKQLLLREEKEIERILSAFSAQIASIDVQLNANQKILAHLDFVFAKAKLAVQMQAVRPKINDKNYINLINVRHPLIPMNKVIPCSMSIGNNYLSLIITGPNTGGKTVSLKTVGLVCLMAQAGLHIPAENETETAIFDNIYADIGDEQSIEQSLSTFSSHMKNIVEIIENATCRDLVLLDELGAGTDPTEGAALAQAILSYFLNEKITNVSTTHYSELKAFALSTAGVENASVEFDVKTLRPTYRLNIGIPGKSNAFEISKSLGLNIKFIQKAQELISSESSRLENAIYKAEIQVNEISKEKQQILDLRAEIEREKANIQQQRQAASKEYERIIENSKKDAQKAVEKTKREAYALLEEAKRLHSSKDTKLHEISSLRAKIQNISYDTDGKNEIKENENKLNISDIKPGIKALYSDNGMLVDILSLPNAKNEVLIQIGAIKMQVSVGKLSQVKENPKSKKSTKIFAKLDKSSSFKLDCDIRGLNVLDGIMEIDKHIDMAILNGFSEITIIHGKGTGALRDGVQKHLKQHSRVKSFRMGLYGEGEAGVTVANLK